MVLRKLLQKYRLKQLNRLQAALATNRLNCTLSPAEGNGLIHKEFQKNKPVLVSRFGSTELLYSSFYDIRQRVFGKCNWSVFDGEDITHQSGVYPTDPESLNRFCQIYIDAIKEIDVLGAWGKPGEAYMHQRYTQAKVVPLTALEPYYHDNPWSQYLEGKSVAVLHPFKSSIESQFKKRPMLFPHAPVLPPFELKTIQAVQSLNANSASKFKSWFEALDFMTEALNKTSFDVLIVGAGAYGLPLGARAKAMGKQVIHLGGATQLLFGIYGSRWFSNEKVMQLKNEAWIRPAHDERPDGNLLENACYW